MIQELGDISAESAELTHSGGKKAADFSDGNCL